MVIPDSARFSYRLMDESDIEFLFQLNQNPEVMRYINGGKADTRDSIISNYIPRMNAFTNVEKGWGLWLVSDKLSREYYGWLLVRPMDFFSDNPLFDDLEIGWRFFQKCWGKGYAFEAAQAMCEVLKTDPKVNSLSAIAFEDNKASVGLMKKIGMSFVKKVPYKTPIGEEDVVYYQKIIKDLT